MVPLNIWYFCVQTIFLTHFVWGFPFFNLGCSMICLFGSLRVLPQYVIWYIISGQAIKSNDYALYACESVKNTCGYDPVSTNSAPFECEMCMHKKVSMLSCNMLIKRRNFILYVIFSSEHFFILIYAFPLNFNPFTLEYLQDG